MSEFLAPAGDDIEAPAEAMTTAAEAAGASGTTVAIPDESAMAPSAATAETNDAETNDAETTTPREDAAAPAPRDAAPRGAAPQAGPVETAVRDIVADTAQRPIEEHPDLFEQAHRTLRDALAAAGN